LTTRSLCAAGTERRNMSSFLDPYRGRGGYSFEPIISSVRPIPGGGTSLSRARGGQGDNPRHGILNMHWGEEASETSPRRRGVKHGCRKVSGQRGSETGRHLVPANYASTMLLPASQDERRTCFCMALRQRSGLSGQDAIAESLDSNKQRRITKSFSREFRHRCGDHSDAATLPMPRMVVEALRAGKTVYVEKPLALQPQ